MYLIYKWVVVVIILKAENALDEGELEKREEGELEKREEEEGGGENKLILEILTLKLIAF